MPKRKFHSTRMIVYSGADLNAEVDFGMSNLRFKTHHPNVPARMGYARQGSVPGYRPGYGIRVVHHVSTEHPQCKTPCWAQAIQCQLGHEAGKAELWVIY